jgi:hypothetical protein
MRRDLVGWLVLLALASGCSENEPTSGEQATSERKSDPASQLHRPLDLPNLVSGRPAPAHQAGVRRLTLRLRSDQGLRTPFWVLKAIAFLRLQKLSFLSTRRAKRQRLLAQDPVGG